MGITIFFSKPNIEWIGGKKIKSAGSQMRREGEKRLDEDISDWLDKWSHEMANCSKIFVSYPKVMTSTLFQPKIQTTNRRNKSVQNSCLFSREDERVTRIPFMIGKPTFKEVLRVHGKLQLLTPLEEINDDQGGEGDNQGEKRDDNSVAQEEEEDVFDPDVDFPIPLHLSDMVRVSSTFSQISAGNTSTIDSEGNSIGGFSTYDLFFSHCMGGDLGSVKEWMESHDLEEQERAITFQSHIHKLMTPLHAACLSSNGKLILYLLNYG